MGPLSVDVAWGELAAAVTVVLGVFAVLGAFYRWVLLPNLREELGRPLRQAARELSGGPDQDSLREKIDSLAEKQEEHTGELEDAALELRAMALMFDGHLMWAQEEVDRLRQERQEMVDAIWAELNRRKDAGEIPGGRHKGDRR